VSRPVVPAPEPLFVAVPPRPQKLLHSEAYIRYVLFTLIVDGTLQAARGK